MLQSEKLGKTKLEADVTLSKSEVAGASRAAGMHQVHYRQSKVMHGGNGVLFVPSLNVPKVDRVRP